MGHRASQSAQGQQQSRLPQISSKLPSPNFLAKPPTTWLADFFPALLFRIYYSMRTGHNTQQSLLPLPSSSVPCPRDAAHDFTGLHQDSKASSTPTPKIPF